MESAGVASSTPGTGTVDDEGTSAGSSGESRDSSSTQAEDDVHFDLGAQPDVEPPPGSGCAGIDFLFVIDNSGSMTAQQGRLLNSFPGFIAGIEASLENVSSYHVGVITSDAYSYNEATCSSLGDLVTQTGAGGACGPFAEGHRFATDADDLETVFPCMAQVGSEGSPIEQPVTATVAALSEAKASPGGCNEGFLRDDAILVLVIVTDDPPFFLDLDDAHPDTDTSPWKPAVLAAKNNDPEAVVVIGFIPINDISCVGPPAASPNLIDFVTSFGPQGTAASVCAADFGPVFDATVATIQTTCDNFEPPG